MSCFGESVLCEPEPFVYSGKRNVKRMSLNERADYFKVDRNPLGKEMSRKLRRKDLRMALQEEKRSRRI